MAKQNEDEFMRLLEASLATTMADHLASDEAKQSAELALDILHEHRKTNGKVFNDVDPLHQAINDGLGVLFPEWDDVPPAEHCDYCLSVVWGMDMDDVRDAAYLLSQVSTKVGDHRWWDAQEELLAACSLRTKMIVKEGGKK